MFRFDQSCIQHFQLDHSHFIFKCYYETETDHPSNHSPPFTRFFRCVGMTFWVDAFEWLALSGITIAIVISVRTLPTSSNVVIPKAWPYLTFLLICCCIIEFISDVLRMLDWTTFQTIAIIFSLVTTIILLPVWLLVLGSWLPAATPTYNQKTDDFYANSCMSMEPDVREPEVNKGEDTDNALAIV